MRAARSAALWIASRSRLRLFVEAAAREPFRARENRRERIVQLVRHARHRLAERREFFRLRQLVIQLARLILQLLSLGDVADDGFDAQRLPAAAVDSARAVTSTHIAVLSARRRRSR